MILGREAILTRLKLGQIFKGCTWHKKHLKEASYALRVAPDGLMLEGKHYRPGEEYIEEDIVIKPGKIAILSTLERLDMPSDLLGKIGIRFKYACQGLTGLMGIQVDPFYGRGHDEERLYIRVANLGNDDITIPVCDEVFTFELHVVYGYVPVPKTRRPLMWHRIQDTLANQSNTSWSNVTQVQVDVEKVDENLEAQGTRLDKQIDSARMEIKDYLQPLVMFGIFLVAVTILGVALSVILTVRETPEVDVPSWVTAWGWVLLLGTLSFAAVATGVMGVLMICGLLKRN